MKALTTPVEGKAALEFEPTAKIISARVVQHGADAGRRRYSSIFEYATMKGRFARVFDGETWHLARGWVDAEWKTLLDWTATAETSERVRDRPTCKGDLPGTDFRMNVSAIG